MGKPYPPPKIKQPPVWIAWFDDLDRVQVQAFIPLYRSKGQIRFNGRMEMLGYRQTVAVTPRMADTKEEALRALMREHEADLDEHRNKMLESNCRVKAIEAVLGTVVRGKKNGS